MQIICPANAPQEGPAVPVTREDLIEHISSGCKTRDRWRIGTEHEKLGFRVADKRRMDYDEIRQVFGKLESRFGWKPIKEGDLTIGVALDKQTVTLEPGGQFELSGAPVATLHQTCAEVNSHLYQAKSIAEELGIGFLGSGFDPKWAINEIPVMPKDRYRLMKAYMPTVGTRGLDMMFRTCTIQVNLDYESEADMVEKFRIGLALQPVAVALFANSPFCEGKPTGEVSTRARVWMDVDKARTGGLPFVFEKGMSFERYVDYAMDVPMYFVYRKGKYIDALGMSWRDFMERQLQRQQQQLQRQQARQPVPCAAALASPAAAPNPLS
ncbi:glutamate--cysteine ligase [Monoraphidium neglectum]|uniref:glutamate--cysteine ligase n=1 Tax=Monoraphidium neglectum TaxID=145388 RepID=A0A0D2MGZ8_9CHLO|nr:glutamate--cysteine ligase [Monoraphidium neglectum]KIY94325.1 glutamate--cysteine ligase [Monoraphidium neglectum]|eukprot:XP_013893345.1 glutamate--cysteine ligase [Monoraphidium neglectum]